MLNLELSVSHLKVEFENPGYQNFLGFLFRSDTEVTTY